MLLWSLLCSLTVPTVRLCLVGAADTPGCVSLLPASLFSNSNPGWDGQRHVTRQRHACCLVTPLLNDCHSQTNPGCCAALRSPRPGLVLGASTPSLIKPSAQVWQGVIYITPPLTWLQYCDFDLTRLFAGLSHRVILKHAETGRTQTYSTGSDVLAQQFAQRVRQLFRWMSCARSNKGNGHIGLFCL